MRPLILSILIGGIPFVSSAQTPLYLNFVSHNEITDTFDYVNSSGDYWQVTNIAKEVADTVISKQAKWNVQLDDNYLFGTLIHDNAATNPNDFLEWASKSAYIDVDGHSHFDPQFNPYNYADLAYLIDSCGAEISENLIGGSWEAPGETWTQYQNPVNGFTYTSFVWQADILWGTASPGHVNDMDIYGIWKPSGATAQTFLQHDPQNHLTSVGGGCKDQASYIIEPQTGLLKHTTDEVVQNIMSLADYINTLPSTSNDFYTLNILMNFRDFPIISNFADSIGKIIDGLQPDVDNGKIVWATIAEKYHLWYNNHLNPADYFVYECDSMSVGITTPINLDPSSVTIYPNPASNLIHINSDYPIDGISLYDLSGRLVIQYAAAQTPDIHLPITLDSGLYLVQVETSVGVATQRLMVIP